MFDLLCATQRWWRDNSEQHAILYIAMLQKHDYEHGTGWTWLPNNAEPNAVRVSVCHVWYGVSQPNVDIIQRMRSYFRLHCTLYAFALRYWIRITRIDWWLTTSNNINNMEGSRQLSRMVKWYRTNVLDTYTLNITQTSSHSDTFQCRSNTHTQMSLVVVVQIYVHKGRQQPVSMQ